VDTKLAARDFNVVELDKGGKWHTNGKLPRFVSGDRVGLGLTNTNSGHTEVESSERAAKRQKTTPLDLEDKVGTPGFTDFRLFSPSRDRHRLISLDVQLRSM
jgi:chromosome transmission fidelity protein 18